MTQLGGDTPPSFLVDLPEELSLAIIEQLDMASIFALSQTCRQFHKLADPADEARRGELHDFLLEVQYFDRWSDGFACFSCNKVLPRESFARKQTRLKRGRNAAHERQVLRFCIPCGLNKNAYLPGNQVGQGDDVRFVCVICKELRDGAFCKRCVICSHCHCKVVYFTPCERNPGHEIIGKTTSGAASACVSSTLASLSLKDNFDDSDDHNGYNDYHGGYYNSDGRRVSQEWSPEWYDGPDDD
jgi:hypothetical protein